VTDPRTTDTAGAGSPAPAVSSAHPTGRPASVDVVAPDARVELDRIRRRWAELPLEQAEARMPLLRGLLADLAARTPRPIATSPPEQAHSGPAGVGGSQEVEVPDLGPAVVVDQLTVLVWDAYANERGDGIPALLTRARRELG
jgi:hypothetical protein